MITIIVNEGTTLERRYEVIHGGIEELTNAVKLLHPDWTTIELVLVRNKS